MRSFHGCDPSAVPDLEVPAAYASTSSSQDRASTVHFVEEREGIFRCGLLVLTRHQLAIEDDVGVVGLDARIHRANLLEDGLRIVRDQEPAPEKTLQLAVSIERISGHPAALDPIRDIAQRNCAVTNRADDFVARPEMLQRARNVVARVKVEGRAATAGHVNSVVNVQIDVPQP